MCQLKYVRIDCHVDSSWDLQIFVSGLDMLQSISLDDAIHQKICGLVEIVASIHVMHYFKQLHNLESIILNNCTIWTKF